MNLLVISGSTRGESLNSRLAQLVQQVRPNDSVTVLNDLDRLPFYDGDVELQGVPREVAALRTSITRVDAVIIVTPEYNGTVPGVLVNAIDWLSRPPGQSVLRAKPVLVLSASPSRYGAVRAAEHLRTVLNHVGAAVAPDGMSVALAHERLNATAVDPDLRTHLSELLAGYLATSSAVMTTPQSMTHNAQADQEHATVPASPAGQDAA